MLEIRLSGTSLLIQFSLCCCWFQSHEIFTLLRDTYGGASKIPRTTFWFEFGSKGFPGESNNRSAYRWRTRRSSDLSCCSFCNPTRAKTLYYKSPHETRAGRRSVMANKRYKDRGGKGRQFLLQCPFSFSWNRSAVALYLRHFIIFGPPNGGTVDVARGKRSIAGHSVALVV